VIQPRGPRRRRGESSRHIARESHASLISLAPAQVAEDGQEMSGTAFEGHCGLGSKKKWKVSTKIAGTDETVRLSHPVELIVMTHPFPRPSNHNSIPRWRAT